MIFESHPDAYTQWRRSMGIPSLGNLQENLRLAGNSSSGTSDVPRTLLVANRRGHSTICEVLSIRLLGTSEFLGRREKFIDLGDDCLNIPLYNGIVIPHAIFLQQKLVSRI